MSRWDPFSSTTWWSGALACAASSYRLLPPSLRSSTATSSTLLAIRLMVDSGRNGRIGVRGIHKGCWWHVCRSWGNISYRGGQDGWPCHWEMGCGCSLTREQCYLLLGGYQCHADGLEVLGHGGHVVIGDLEVGIVGYLDGSKTLSNRADAVVVCCVGCIPPPMIPVGIGGAYSRS